MFDLYLAMSSDDSILHNNELKMSKLYLIEEGEHLNKFLCSGYISWAAMFLS